MAEILDKFEVHTASDLARAVHRKLQDGIVADAPPDADRIQASVAPWPAWLAITLILGASLLLWAAIIGAVWWLAGR